MNVRSKLFVSDVQQNADVDEVSGIFTSLQIKRLLKLNYTVTHIHVDKKLRKGQIIVNVSLAVLPLLCRD